MKIRILEPFETGRGRILKGTIIDVTPKVAQRWVSEGDAELVETQGGQTESRRPHKPEIAGSTPAPATKRKVKNHRGKKVETASLEGGEVRDGT